jgi:hypothetical protein
MTLGFALWLGCTGWQSTALKTTRLMCLAEAAAPPGGWGSIHHATVWPHSTSKGKKRLFSASKWLLALALIA